MGWTKLVDYLMNLLRLDSYNDPKIRIALIIFLIALVVLFLMIIIWIFSIIIRKSKRRKKKKSAPKKENSEKEITPEEKMILFDKKIKKYFKDYLNQEKESNYTELAEKLKEKNQEDLSGFCKRMNYYMYSRKKIQEEDIRDLDKHFKNLIKPKKNQRKTKTSQKT